MKINILESSVYNRISAGEVVERPSSVVKELIENSIDAGASDITVKIAEGGIQNITVIDNGCGITKDYVATAFLPHATSKISNIDDLDSISTLGFRGEALASISSVSKIDIKTKTLDDDFGYQMQSVGGEIKFEGVCPCANGTSISVSNLFFNTPARGKFLKKPKQEENEITSVIQQIIFANPNVAIKYIADDSVKTLSLGEGIESCIENVYDKEILKYLKKVDYEKYGIKINGFVSVPEFSKSNRNFQTIIVNGRYIKNQTISTAVMQAFGNLLMRRAYPVFVLNIVIPFDEIDVNVHPNKIEVRFLNSQQIFSTVYHGVQNAISGFETPHVDNGVLKSTFSSVLNINTANEIKAEKQSAESFEDIKKRFDSIKLNTNKNVSQDDDMPYNVPQILAEMHKNTGLVAEKSIRYSIDSISIDESINRLDETYLSETTPKPSKLNNNILGLDSYSIRIVGQIFDTYIIVCRNDNVYIIDQHAAHERILYDRLVSDYNDKNSISQGLFLPYVLNLDSHEYEFVSENLETFKNFGFEICEANGLSFEVFAVPTLLADMDIKSFFKKLFDQNIVDFKLTDGLVDKLSQIACKGAIKAGYSLSEQQISYFVELFIKEDMALKCPHGRPIVLKFSKTDLEKKFKRIV